MPTDLLKKEDDDGDEGKHMSGGAIAGLVIGLILAVGLIIFFIMWYFRFRHYWTSHKHKKMPNHGTESRVAGGAHNNPYMSDVANDGPVHSDAWGVGPGKQTSAFSESWWPSANNPMPPYVSQTTPYPMASAPWPEVAESRMDPVLTVPTHCAVQMCAADPTSVPGPRGHFNFEQAGDLSQTAQGAIGGLYPQLRSSLTSGEEPTTTTTSSNGKQILGHGMSQRMRSKVRMAARVSQLNMFNLRSRRRTSTRIHESTRGRPKRRRGTRNSSVTIGGATVIGGSKFSMTPGEGYHNMNVISDSFEFDELGSLDNDEFLCSLERAVFPGLDGSHLSSLSGNQTHRSQHSSSNDIQFRNLGIASNVVYPMSDFHSLATADLSLGGVQEPADGWRPLPPELDNSSSSRSSQPIGFRFPTPGPPVAGWAHQLPQFSTQAEPKLATANNASAPTRSPPRTMTASSCEPTVPIAPAIQPPPEISSSSDRTQSITPAQTLASLSAAIPRRRAQKRIKTRQQSEPRVTGSRIVGNVSDAFEQMDTSSGFNGVHAALNRSLSPVTVSYHARGFFTPHSRPVPSHLPASFTQPTSPVQMGNVRTELAQSSIASALWQSGPRHPLEQLTLDRSPISTTSVVNPTDKMIYGYGQQQVVASGSSSSGTGRASNDSTTAMLPASSKRSVSASRHPLLPEAIHRHSQNLHQTQHRSPSFPNFFINTGTDLTGLQNAQYGLTTSPGVFSASPQPVWTDISQSNHP